MKLPAPVGRLRGVTGILDETTDYGLLPGAAELRVEQLGSRSLAGTVVTGFALTPAPACLAPASAGPRLTVGSLQVWVDEAGRLVEAQSSLSDVISRGALRGGPGAELTGSTTTTESLRLSDFGISVHVIAPPLQRLVRQNISGTSIAVLRPAGARRACGP